MDRLKVKERINSDRQKEFSIFQITSSVGKDQRQMFFVCMNVYVSVFGCVFAHSQSKPFMGIYVHLSMIMAAQVKAHSSDWNQKCCKFCVILWQTCDVKNDPFYYPPSVLWLKSKSFYMEALSGTRYSLTQTSNHPV